jgi:diguanylate cyclase (GGDEF)-like protein
MPTTHGDRPYRRAPWRDEERVIEPWQIASQHYPVRVISRSEGLPSGQVHTLAIDSQGIVWLAGPNGLAKYDGIRVRTFTQRQGLTTQGLRTVAAAPDDTIWIGNDVGVDLIRNGTVETMPGGWHWGLTNSIVAEPNGKMWLGAALGLISWEPDHGFTPESDARLTDSMIQMVALDSEGNPWVAVRHHGLLRRSQNEWFSVATNIGAITTLGAGENGTMFVGGEFGALHLNTAGTVHERIRTPPGSVSAIFAQQDELWLGVDTELRHHRLTSGGWTFEQTVISGSRINMLSGDDDGNVWAATDIKGLAKVEGVRRALSRPNLGLGAVFSIRSTRSGAYLMAGDQGSALVRLGDASQRQPTTVAGLPSLARTHAWDLIEDRFGDYWAATQTGLQHHQIDGTMLRIGSDHPVLGAPGRALLERPDGLWVGTINGLCVINGASIETKTAAGREVGRSLGYVYSLVGDGESVWIGTLGNGLWRDTGTGPKRCLAEGLSKIGNSYAVALNDDGTAAILQDNRVVLLRSDGTSRILTEVDEALAGWAVVWGEDATLWVGSSTGLCRYSTRTGALLKQITLWMGIDGWEFTTNRGLVRHHDGRVLCGLDSGLTVVDAARVEEMATRRPDVVLNTITWTNTSPEVAGERTIVDEGKWFLEADVYSTWRVHEAHRGFRFRLLGFEAGWSEPSNTASIRYSSLPPGSYTLQAQAHSPLSGWGSIAELLTFHVRATRWRTRWEQWTTSDSRRKIGRLRQESHLLEQKVRERTVELSGATAQLALAHAEVTKLSLTDALTGVPNRRQFDEAIEQAIVSVYQDQLPTTLLLIDIDSFKQYNDTLGHLAGDQCLQEVAKALQSDPIMAGHLVARYGGEEFAVLLRGVPRARAMKMAEQLRLRVRQLGIPHPSSAVADVVTISIGLASAEPGVRPRATAAHLIDAADDALYQAKDAGRDRVACDPTAAR